VKLPRTEYVARYGPTTGDRVRLGDTDLWIEVEADHVGAGDEPMWGYAKNFRSRQAQFDRAGADSELDMVIAGVVVVDPLLGVVKTNIGIKDGRIAGVGRAGSPEIADDVELVIGPDTWPVNGHGLIATAGAVDSHVHLITPALVPVALCGGVTTLITAGFEEPPYVMERTYLAFEDVPMNLGLQASARTDVREPVERLLEAGACGLKIHEDWGAYPEVIDAVLAIAEDHDVQVCLHTDGLNESCELEDTLSATRGRTIHAYHVEGTGGGHVPDLIGIVRAPNVICSSTTPTLPFGPSTATEHLEMILAVHGGSPFVPEDVQAARERIHPATMAAEGPLHELGAIQIVNSDSQGMGRIGETVRRTFQLAHQMKAWRASEAAREVPNVPQVRRLGPHTGDDVADNERVLRYLAKVTLEPAIAHGISNEVGSLAPGGLADLVLWRPSWFGVRPELVIKGGAFAWGAIGEGNATIEGAMPVLHGPHWGATGRAGASIATTFVSRVALEGGIRERLGSRRRFVAVEGTRGLTRDSFVANRALPAVEVDRRDGTVTLEGRVLASDPVTEVPLSRRYLLA
jgi:urease subunit alpha